MKGCGEEKRKSIDRAGNLKRYYHLLLVVGKVLDDVLTDLRVGVDVEERDAEVNIQNSPILISNLKT